MSTLDIANDLDGNFTSLVAWNYVYCSNSNQTNYSFITNSSQPICVCDWRVNIYGCDNTSTLLNIFFISTVVSLFAGVSIFILLIYKTCRKGQTFWAPPRRTPPPIIPKRTGSGGWVMNDLKLNKRSRFGIEGILRPKPVECYLLFSCLHMLARSVAFGFILNRSTQNFPYYVLIVELCQVMPWIFQWIAIVLYVIGLYYHIPMNKPARQMLIDCLGPIMIFVPPILSIVIVVLSSLKRQNYNVVRADALEQMNMLLWAVANGLLVFCLLVVTRQLWKAFNSYVREVELVGSRSDAIRVRRLQRGFSQMKIVITFLLIPVLFFTICLPVYAYRREYLLLKNTGFSVNAMAIWFLGIPITMCFTTALITYCTFKQDPEEIVITPTQSLQNMDEWDLSPHNPAIPSKPLPSHSQLENRAIKPPRSSQPMFEMQVNLYLNPLPSPRRIHPQEKLGVQTSPSALGASSSRIETTSWQDFEMRIQDSSLLPPSPVPVARPPQRSIGSFRNHFESSRNQPVQSNEKHFPESSAAGSGDVPCIQLKRNSVESSESVKSFDTFGAASNVMYD